MPDLAAFPRRKLSRQSELIRPVRGLPLVRAVDLGEIDCIVRTKNVVYRANLIATVRCLHSVTHTYGIIAHSEAIMAIKLRRRLLLMLAAS